MGRENGAVRKALASQCGSGLKSQSLRHTWVELADGRFSPLLREVYLWVYLRFLFSLKTNISTLIPIRSGIG